ncbi:MAG TPA: hypothetical protein VJQ26_14165, partial [Ktedonobacteraceae bacterium]|nr:hypothetical protein [Ktedonobacteraceae bacterium]
ISRPRPREPPVTTTTSPLKSKLTVPIDASSVFSFHRLVLYISFVARCLTSICWFLVFPHAVGVSENKLVFDLPWRARFR